MWILRLGVGYLTQEMNLTNKMLKNIVIEVEQDKPGLKWLEQQRAFVNPTQKDTNPASTIYVQAVEKFVKMKARGVDGALAVKFKVEVSATLKDALTNLPAIDRFSKPKVVVIFLYDSHGESLYLCLADVSIVNSCILKKEEN